MPKKIAPEVKEKAMELYLRGDLTAKEISEELQRVFKADVKVPTIYAWSREAKWNDKQIEAEEALQTNQVAERELAKSLNDVYGPGSLDPETGVFTPTDAAE